MHSRTILEDSDEEDVVRATLQQLEDLEEQTGGATAQASQDGEGEGEGVGDEDNDEGKASDVGEEDGEEQGNGEV